MDAELVAVDGTPIKALDGKVVVPGWTHQLDGPGAGQVEVAAAHPDYGELVGDRIIALHDRVAGAVHGFVLKDSGGELSDDPAVRVWSGRGCETKLGAQDDRRAVLVGDAPESGLVTYGWVARSWDASDFVDGLISGGHVSQPRNSSWRVGKDRPDIYAEWIVAEDSDDPDDEYWVRHTFDVHGVQEGVTLWLAGRAEVYLNGASVVETERVSDVTRVTVDLTANDVLAVKITRRAAWVLGRDVDDTFRVYYRSTTGAPYSVDRSEIQTVTLDPESPPYPWGSDYPSTGPDNLQGTWSLTVPGFGSTPAVRSGSALQWDDDAGDVAAALEGISGIVDVTVTGSGTPASPFRVEFVDPSGPMPLMKLNHSDLRHDHGDTAVNTVRAGRSTLAAKPGANKLVGKADEPDGVTYGYVAVAALQEVQGRGALPGVNLAGDPDPADADNDSNGDPWAVSLPLVSFRANVEQVGDVLDQCRQKFSGHLQVTPYLDVWITNDPGDDLTATVDVAGNVVDAKWAEPNGETITHVRASVDGGSGWVATGASGPRREAAAQYGTARSVAEIRNDALQLAADLAGVRVGRWTMGDLRSPRPYVAFTVGDTVRWTGPGGTWDCLVVEIAPKRVDQRVEFDVQWRQV